MWLSKSVYHWNFSHSRNKCSSLLLKTRHLPTGYWVFLPTYTRLPSPKQDQNRERQDKRSPKERRTCTQGWVWISPCHTSTFVRAWTEYRKTEFQIQTPWHWNCSILEKCNYLDAPKETAAAPKSLQSWPTLHDPIDSSPPSSRQEYWSGLPFPSPMHACMLSHFSHVRLRVTLWTAAHQAPLSTGFSRQE